MVEDVRVTIAESGRGIHKVFESTNPALLIIDMQQAIDSFSTQVRSNPAAQAVVESLLLRWRESELPVVHVRHASKYPDSPYHDSAASFAFKPELAPREDEVVITKQENCAFIATDLEQVLRDKQVSELVVCGVLVNNSVDATVRVAAALGFRVYLPSDGTAAFAMDALNGKHYSAEDVHWISLSTLDGEYARVVESRDVHSDLVCE